MPYDGNGNFVRVHNWTADAANSVDINAVEMDAEDNGFASALSNAVTRDGQGKISVDFLPNVDNTLNLGNGSLRWASINGVPIPSANTPWNFYPRTAAEALAGVTPVNFFYPPGTVLRYGTNSVPGTTDMSAAFQSAFNCNVTVYVPGGSYLVGGLIMPSTTGFVFYGDGTSSILIQKADGNPLISWNQSSIVYTEGYVERLAFKGTAGTGHTIDTTGVGGITLQDLFFTDTPVNKSSIYLNGAAATYMHDHRLRNIQIYTNTAGHSGIRCGPLCSDSDIDNFIMNGNFQTSYGLYLDVGAQTVTLANSHPYNAAINIVHGAGSNGSCYLDSCTLDNATNDILVMIGATNFMATQCHFEAIQSGQNGITLTNCAASSFANCEWDAVSGAAHALTETGTTNQTFIFGGNIGTLGNYTSGPFNLIGSLSWARGIAGYNPLGMSWSLLGCTASVQAQSTTQFLGVNGAQANAINTEYVVAWPALIGTFSIAVSATPAAGQTFTFTLKNGGGTTLGTITINNGSFSGSAVVNSSVGQNDVLYIQSVFSATSGSSNIRWAINLTA